MLTYANFYSLGDNIMAGSVALAKMIELSRCFGFLQFIAKLNRIDQSWIVD